MVLSALIKLLKLPTKGLNHNYRCFIFQDSLKTSQSSSVSIIGLPLINRHKIPGLPLRLSNKTRGAAIINNSRQMIMYLLFIAGLMNSWHSVRQAEPLLKHCIVHSNGVGFKQHLAGWLTHTFTSDGIHSFTYDIRLRKVLFNYLFIHQTKFNCLWKRYTIILNHKSRQHGLEATQSECMPHPLKTARN